MSLTSPVDTAPKALRQLQNLLIGPSVESIKTSPVHSQRDDHWVEVVVLLPGHHLDTSEIGMRMDVRFEKDSLTTAQDLSDPTFMNRLLPIDDLSPLELEEVPVSANHDYPHRIKLYYKQPALENRIDKYVWEFRLRHHVNADLSLPLGDPNDKDNTDSTWVIERDWTTRT